MRNDARYLSLTPSPRRHMAAESLFRFQRTFSRARGRPNNSPAARAHKRFRRTASAAEGGHLTVGEDFFAGGATCWLAGVWRDESPPAASVAIKSRRISAGRLSPPA